MYNVYMDFILSFFATLVIIFIVPILIYGIFSRFFGVQEPEKKLKFFIGVLIEKAGTSLGFVGLFYLGREFFIDNWLIYGLVWFAMFAITEIGQIFTTGSPKKEALAGIISEATYFPLAAYLISTILY